MSHIRNPAENYAEILQGWLEESISISSNLWSNSAYVKLIFFLIVSFFSPENMIWHFMQMVSQGDSLHAMSNPIFWKKNRKAFLTVIAEIFTQHVNW